MTQLLNLGCGSRFCSESCWTNIDFQSSHSRVISHNLLEGVPFPVGTFDAVYHSNVLEHFTREAGTQLIRECYRVLKPAGVLRVVVPDLEQICRLYLQSLDRIEAGDTVWESRHDWIILEMYDQSVRSITGGEMARYLQQPNLPDKEFIIARIGNVGRNIIGATANPTGTAVIQDSSRNWKWWANKVKHARDSARAWLKDKALSDPEKQALALGRFRLGGEVHQWMFDRYSLREVFKQAGFENTRQCTASDSHIPDWNTYFLDVDRDGFEHAPSALYMEGVKPQ